MLSVDLSGKRALVTGANSGIGAAVAKVLADAGADVAINYVVRPEDAETVAKDIRTKGRNALTVEADISDPDAVSTMVQKVIGDWGGLDIVVNNAGIDGARMLGWGI